MTPKSSALRWFAVALSVLASTAALAQFRPPPMTEAERLTNSGHEAREEGTRAIVKGDKQEGQQKLKKAVDYYLEALKANPDAVPAASGLGEAASVLGDHKLVIATLLPVATAHPESIEVAYHLGASLLKSDRAREALPLLEVASKADKPEHLVVHFYLGRLHLQDGRGDASAAELLRYLQQRPEKLAKNDGEIYLMLGHAQLLARKPREARAAFDSAQKGRPEALPIQMGLEAVLELEGRTADAIKLLDGLAARNPTSPEPPERLGWLLLLQSNLPRAEAAALSAVKLRETATIRQLLGEIRLAQQKPAVAEPDLRRAVQLQPGLLAARFSLARAVQAQGRSDEAIGLLEEVARGGLNRVELWAALGSVYRRAGRYQEAVQNHLKVVEMAPNQPLGRLLLGADYSATGQWDQAITEYDRALKIDVNNARAKHFLGLALLQRARVLSRNEQLDDAVRDLRRGLDLERTAQVARALAAVLLTQKAYPDAVGVLEKGRLLPGASWKDWLLLGYAQLGAGAPADAVKAFEEAAKGTTDPNVTSDIYAGWALAKLELGEFDTAVSKLMEPSQSRSALEVMQKNLPVALVRRALEKLKAGDSASAAADLERAENAVPQAPALTRLVRFAKALVLADQREFIKARQLLKQAVGTGTLAWQLPNTGTLADAYLSYREDRIDPSRKVMTSAKKKASESQASFFVQLERALDRREGELAYLKGTMPKADKAFKKALAADPLNPNVINNAACVQYRTGKFADAVAGWQRVADNIPVATLNLGIEAQLRQKDIQQAVDYYAKYAAMPNVLRAAQVREWKNRLSSIHGVTATQSGGDDDAPPPDGTEAPSTLAEPPPTDL